MKRARLLVALVAVVAASLVGAGKSSALVQDCSTSGVCGYCEWVTELECSRWLCVPVSRWVCRY